MTRPALVIGWFLLLAFGPRAIAQDRGPGVPNPQPQLWAIVVGIDDYKNPAMPRSTGSVTQARNVLRWLRNQWRVGQDPPARACRPGKPRPR